MEGDERRWRRSRLETKEWKKSGGVGGPKSNLVEGELPRFLEHLVTGLERWRAHRSSRSSVVVHRLDRRLELLRFVSVTERKARRGQRERPGGSLVAEGRGRSR